MTKTAQQTRALFEIGCRPQFELAMSGHRDQAAVSGT
jgi:hypothetical protein